ncbi:radical SAM protein [Acidobacteria bacterium AH-259-A15]|nr:radical SAM protein [Acidobacteria bacterium AH-259-A15]
MTVMFSRAVKDVKIASRLFYKRGLPVSLIFFVTSRCNLLCTHCFYWEELNKRKNELTLDEIEKISRSLPNLLTVSLTGGEPYLRADLPDIARAFEQNSHVRNIQIPSNGLLVERTVSRVEALMQKVHRARVSTGVSLDGPEDIHNRIRQNPKSFERALQTLAELKKLKPHFPNLSVGVALTVSSANQDRLGEFYRFVEEELQPDAVTITLVRGNPIDASLKKVDLRLYHDFARQVIEYRTAHRLTNGWMDRLVIAKEEETYRLIGEAAQASKRISPCYGGELIGVLSETGEVYVCETLDKSMGNVRDFDCDFAKLWQGELAEEGRHYQKELGCQCTYECAMSINSLFNPKRALRILKRGVRP